MNALARVIARFRGPGVIGPDDRVERILQEEGRRIQATDPDTAGQWNLLQAALPAAAPNTVRGARLFLRPAFALTVAAAGLVALFTLLRQPDSVAYETGRGRHSTVLLADSSQVILNHTTRLEVRGAGSHEPRDLTLDGEAFFRVRHTGYPFLVRTGMGSVEVLGTEFNVRVRNSRMELTVIRGKVRLSDGLRSVDVDSGRVAVCAPGTAPALSDRPAPAGEPGWMSGRFEFYRTPLAEACREFEEYFDTRIMIADPSLRTRTITGTIQADRAETAITILARLTGTNARHESTGHSLH